MKIIMRNLGVYLAGVLMAGLLAVPAATLAREPMGKTTKVKSEVTQTDQRLDRYWQMEKERLTAARDHLKDRADIIAKHNGVIADARDDLSRLDMEYEARVAEIDKKYSDVITEENMAVGKDEKALEKDRQDFLKSHPDVNKDITSLNTEIAGLEKDAKTDANKADTAEENYWKMEQERLTTAKNHYTDVLGTYNKKLSATDTAADIKSLDDKYKSDVQALTKKYDSVITRDKMAAGNDRKEMNERREAYLKSHPDLEKRITGLRSDISELQKKIETVKPKKVG